MWSRTNNVGVVIFLLVFICLCQCNALYPYGELAGDTVLTGNQSHPLFFETAFPYFDGVKKSVLTIFKDGFLTFDLTPHNVFDFDPRTEVNFPAIAVWISRMKPNSTLGGSGAVFYRQSQDSAILDQLGGLARNFEEFSRSYKPLTAFVVTWDSIGPVSYNETTYNVKNTFQVVLATDGNQSLVTMNYPNIQWIFDGLKAYIPLLDTAGDVLIKTEVGFYKGNSMTWRLLPASKSIGLYHISEDTNANQEGLYVFRVDVLPANLTLLPTNNDYSTNNNYNTDCPCRC